MADNVCPIFKCTAACRNGSRGAGTGWTGCACTHPGNNLGGQLGIAHPEILLLDIVWVRTSHPGF